MDVQFPARLTSADHSLLFWRPLFRQNTGWRTILSGESSLILLKGRYRFNFKQQQIELNDNRSLSELGIQNNDSVTLTSEHLVLRGAISGPSGSVDSGEWGGELPPIVSGKDGSGGHTDEAGGPGGHGGFFRSLIGPFGPVGQSGSARKTVAEVGRSGGGGGGGGGGGTGSALPALLNTPHKTLCDWGSRVPTPFNVQPRMMPSWPTESNKY
ncbi:hypothetical protein B0H14DRAFT_2617942 [Mycena olivaceomarginata]|nr:hypothetical protein B0H14DRAFT_2617942 [Mycena olivaceomarginata]